MMMLSQNITALKSSCSTLKGRCPIGGRFQKAVSPICRRNIQTPKAFFGLFNKEEDPNSRFSKAAREEQFRLQKEILDRRRNNSWQKDVQERRAKVSRYNRDPEFKKKVDEENRKKFLENKAKEEPEPKFGIIIPLIPIGLPEYDGGERFDLRLPYVDNGWVDEDADFGKQVSKFFGFGKKKNEDTDGKTNKKK